MTTTKNSEDNMPRGGEAVVLTGAFGRIAGPIAYELGRSDARVIFVTSSPNRPSRAVRVGVTR